MAGESTKIQILGDFRALHSECQSKIKTLSGSITIDSTDRTVLLF